MSETAYRDPTPSIVDSLTRENADLKSEVERLNSAVTKRRTGTFIRAAVILGSIGAVVLGIGATARTCAYGGDARRNAEREATEYHRRSHGAVPFAVLCAAEADQSDYDYTCLVYRVVADPSPIVIRCDSDPARWNDGCRGARRAP